MTKTATDIMLEIAERHAPTRLDEMIVEYLRSIPDEQRESARDELSKFAKWFKATYS
jgi:hypothetical protein